MYGTVTVLTLLCCSAYGAFTVNVYDDVNQESDTFEDINSCDYQECDQLCRRLGFPGGACVNGRCKCDIIQNDDTLVRGLRSCDLLECEQQCRRIGFPGGACINGRCKCDIIQFDDDNEISVNGEADVIGEVNNDLDVLRNKQTPVSEIMMRSSAVRSGCDCVPRNCDMYCFRIHYTGGICVTGSCRCYK